MLNVDHRHPDRILDQGQPSSMAEQAAVMRAVHQLIDGEPKIFADPLALKILGPVGERWVRDNLDKYRPAYMASGRVLTAIRSQFAEERLLASMQRGTAQYVILGAGLDTFAWRHAELAGRLAIFEVDHPATQQWKRSRLSEVGLGVPGHVQFVAVDFQRDSLATMLAASGFSRTRPAFFSWLGVTYYLTPEAAFDTLCYVATQDAASEVVFDFALEDAAMSPRFREQIAKLMTSMVKRGEPWLTRFEPTALQARLRASGFAGTFYLSEALATERYLRARPDRLELGEAVQIMAAWK